MSDYAMDSRGRWVVALTGISVPFLSDAEVQLFNDVLERAGGWVEGFEEPAPLGDLSPAPWGTPRIPAATPAFPVPLVTLTEGAYYHEDQLALHVLRGELGNTCASHALNALIGGPASNYEYHRADTIEGFDGLVASLHLPALEWRDFGAGFPVPADIDTLSGPRRVVVQLSYLDSFAGESTTHFLALRGDGGTWRAIDSMRLDQPVLGDSLFGALNHFLAQPNTQVSVGTWPPGTVLPAVQLPVEQTADKVADQATVDRFAENWPNNAEAHASVLQPLARWLSDSGNRGLSELAAAGTITPYLLEHYAEESGMSPAEREAVATATARLTDFMLVQALGDHIRDTQGLSTRDIVVNPLTAFAGWLDSRGTSSLHRLIASGMVPEYLIAQFLSDERFEDPEAQAVRLALKQIASFLRFASSGSAPQQTTVGSGISDAALQTAVLNKDVQALHLIHADVTSGQWRQHADAVLELLPAIISDHHRRDIAAAVAEAIFEEDAGAVDLQNKTPQQQGRIMASLVFGSLMDETMDLNDDRFLTIQQLFRGTSNQTTDRATTAMREAAIQAARALLPMLHPDITTIDLNRIPNGAVGEFGRRDALQALGFGR